MTCRDEVLSVVRELVSGRSERDFLLSEVLDKMRERQSKYGSGVIGTQVSSRMCKNSPAHHATRYPDFERIGEGHYRLL